MSTFINTIVQKPKKAIRRSFGDLSHRNDDSLTKLPPIPLIHYTEQAAINQNLENEINILGNAINCPPAKESTKSRHVEPVKHERKQKSMSPKRTSAISHLSSQSNNTITNNNNVKNVTRKISNSINGNVGNVNDTTNNSKAIIDQLKKEIGALKRENANKSNQLEKYHFDSEQLKIKLEKSLSKNEKLQKTIADFENELNSLKRLLEEERNNHNCTKTYLEKLNIDFNHLKSDHAVEINQLQTTLQHHEKLEITLKEEKTHLLGQLTDKESKLNQLKRHMADSFKGNSMERQQQLDELTKELQKMQEEHEQLRLKYNSLVKKYNDLGDNCPRCSQTKESVRKAQRLVESMGVALERIEPIESNTTTAALKSNQYKFTSKFPPNKR